MACRSGLISAGAAASALARWSFTVAGSGSAALGANSPMAVFLISWQKSPLSPAGAWGAWGGWVPVVLCGWGVALPEVALAWHPAVASRIATTAVAVGTNFMIILRFL